MANCVLLNTFAELNGKQAATDPISFEAAALSLVGNPTNAVADVADIVAALDGQVARRSGTAVGFGAVDLANANAVTGVLPEAHGGSVALRASVLLANADIVTLPTIAVTIPIPGLTSGVLVNVLSVNYFGQFTGGAYTGIDPAYADIHVTHTGAGDYCGGYVPDDPASTPVLTQFTDFFGTAWDAIVQSNRYAEGFQAAGASYVLGIPGIGSASLAGAGLSVGIENGGVDLGGGDAANTLRVTVTYTLEPL